MEDIKKAIEVLKYHQEWRKGAEMPQTDVKELTSALDTAIDCLSKWEESTRWRKVEEELPEMGVEVLVTRNDGVMMLAWLDEDSEPFFNVSDNEEYFIDDIHSWKPIH